MKVLLLPCLLLGAMVVFQPALNRIVLEQKGLGFAIWQNSLVFFLTSCLLLVAIYIYPERFPELMRLKAIKTFDWWHIFPGLLGLIMVAGVPLMIKHLGAVSTMIAMLSGQLLTSFLWDWLVLGQKSGAPRVVGIALALLGAYLSVRK